MAGRITIDVGLNTREVAKGAKDAEKALENLEDAVSDAGKGGSKDLKTLERELKDVQDAGEKAGKGISDGVGKGFDEVKSEASQSGREAAASFSGEWSDVGDFVQETVANGLSGFGPLGAAAGIAAAAGIGALTATILDQQEQADKLKERLSSAYQEAAEEGRNYLDTAQLIAEASDLMFNTDRAAEWKQVQADAKQLGLDVYDVIAANAGAQDKQREVQERINALVDDHNEKLKNNELTYEEMESDVFGLSDRWRDVIGLTEEEQQKARQLADIQKKAEEENRAQIDRTAASAQSRYEGLAALYGKPIQTTIKVNVDDNAAWAALNRLTAPKSVDMRVKPRGTAEWQ